MGRQCRPSSSDLADLVVGASDLDGPALAIVQVQGLAWVGRDIACRAPEMQGNPLRACLSLKLAQAHAIQGNVSQAAGQATCATKALPHFTAVSRGTAFPKHLQSAFSGATSWQM